MARPRRRAPGSDACRLRLAGAELRRELRARGRERLRLLNLVLHLLARDDERVALARARARETAPARQQLAAQDRLLLHARVDDLRLLLHAVADLLRARTLHGDLMLRGRDRRGDALVLLRDRAEIVELVDHVVEAARGEQHVDGRRLVLLVDVDEAKVEPLQRELVLVPQVRGSGSSAACRAGRACRGAAGGARGRTEVTRAARTRRRPGARACGSASSARRSAR